MAALVGIFLDLASEPAERPKQDDGSELDEKEPQPESSAFLIVLHTVLAFIALGIASFQGWLYFQYLSGTAGAQIGALGGLIFALISVAESAAFYFITKLVVPGASAALLYLVRMLLSLAAFFFRVLGAIFESIPKRTGALQTPQQTREAGSETLPSVPSSAPA